MRYKLIGAVGYLAALTMFAYSSDEFIPEWIAILVIFVLPFAAGFVSGLWALLAPPVAVLVAVPVGYGLGEFPVSFEMTFVGIIAIPAIVIGWGARWAVEYYARRSRHRGAARYARS